MIRLRKTITSVLFFIALLFSAECVFALPPACPSAAEVQQLNIAKIPGTRVGQLEGEETWVLGTGPDATIPFIDKNNMNKKRNWVLVMHPFPASYEQKQIMGIANQMIIKAPSPAEKNAVMTKDTGTPTWICIYPYPDTPGPIQILMLSYDE